MSTPFERLLMADMANAFCNPAEFGEAVVFIPRVGLPRSINVQVFRTPPVKQPGVAAAVAFPADTVLIPRGTDAATSVTATPDAGDVLMVPKHRGDAAAQRRQVGPILREDAGGWLVQLR